MLDLEHQYTPDFVSEAQALSLSDELNRRPAWRQVSGRQLQQYGGEVVGGVLISQPLPRPARLAPLPAGLFVQPPDQR